MALGLLLPAAARADAAAALAAANAAWTAGDAAAAQALYEQALGEDPASAGALYGRALCQLQSGHDREALDSLDQALRLQPAMPAAARLRQEALTRLNRAEALPLVGAADLDRRLGRWEAAERGYHLALLLSPGMEEALAGLAAVARQRSTQSSPAAALDAAVRSAPVSPEALGLRDLMNADRSRPMRGWGSEAQNQGPSSRWTGSVHSGPQWTQSQNGSTDRDSLDAVFFAHAGWEGDAAPLDLGYTFLDVHSDVAGAWSSVTYQAVNAAWWASGRGRPGPLLLLDEALESGQGQLLYWHHQVDARWMGQPVGDWQPWADVQALWERYASMAELDSLAPSVGLGLAGPLPGAGQAQAEVRWRLDSTDDWSYHDHGASMHVAGQWRSGRSLSPRLDLDAKAQVFPQWPGAPGRRDLMLDSRLELVLWQGSQASLSTVLEWWRHDSDLAAYAGQGSTQWLGGTWAW